MKDSTWSGEVLLGAATVEGHRRRVRFVQFVVKTVGIGVAQAFQLHDYCTDDS
jgi:hypothetical protein